VTSDRLSRVLIVIMTLAFCFVLAKAYGARYSSIIDWIFILAIFATGLGTFIRRRQENARTAKDEEQS
jgi:amino acid permease